MSAPLMPKATALWLIEKTALTFQQIADFCEFHVSEVQAIADEEIGVGLKPFDPIANGQLSQENLDACVKNSGMNLILLTPHTTQTKTIGRKYIPLSKRKEHPQLSDQQIITLLSTTKPTIESVRHKSHWNSSNIKPRSPIVMELCTQEDLNTALSTAKEN